MRRWLRGWWATPGVMLDPALRRDIRAADKQPDDEAEVWAFAAARAWEENEASDLAASDAMPESWRDV